MGLTIGGPPGEPIVENPEPDATGFMIGLEGYQFRFDSKDFGLETFKGSAPGREGTIFSQLERTDSELGFLTPNIVRALLDGKRLPEESRQLDTREVIQRLIQSDSVELVRGPQRDENAQSAGLLSGLSGGKVIALGALAGGLWGLLRSGGGSGGGSAQEGENEGADEEQ